MVWWIWLLVGFVLLLAELLTPGGFFVIFFGIGALTVGILDGFGLAGPPEVQWILFSAVSVVSLFLFRKRLVAWAKRSQMEERPGGVDAMVGEVATLIEALEPHGVAKAELRGTSWSVRSDSQYVIPKGTRCRVTRVDGLTLWVRTE